MEEMEKLIEMIEVLDIDLDTKSGLMIQLGRSKEGMMVGTKRVILLAVHNFISPRCNTNIDGKLITEFDMTSYLVTEVFKRERLIGINLIIKTRNDFRNLVNEVNSLNGDILISCHFNAYDRKVKRTEVLYAHTSSKGRKLTSVAQNILTKHLGLLDRRINQLNQKIWEVQSLIKLSQ